MQHQAREYHIEQNKAEYGGDYDLFNWISKEKAKAATTKRDRLLAEIETHVTWDYNRTKADCRALSPGCRSCGEGTWSCLFINNMCNATCFFCPSVQNEISEPATSSISFPDPKDYIAYIRQFRIKGVSISGGEPLITWDKSLRFIKEVRNAFGDGIYLWLYTNGLLMDRNKAVMLRDAGLDEIRFDLSATGYKTGKLKHAAGVIKNVTVEIPAIPEDLETLKNLLPELKDEGVGFLHLHQLRCTPYNQKKLRGRNYTFLHGPKVSVLESELAALELMAWERRNKIGLPVNYCSFVYKNKFQAINARKRYAPLLINTYEDITPSGFVRSLFFKGEKEKVTHLVEEFNKNGTDPSTYQVANHGEILRFSISLWPMIKSENNLHVDYFNPIVRPNVSYFHFFKEIKLSEKKKVVLEKVKCFSKLLSPADHPLFDNIYTGSYRTDDSSCYAFEWFSEGLQEYY